MDPLPVGSLVRLRASNYPTKRFRHCNRACRIGGPERLYDEDSLLYVVAGAAGTGSISLVPHNCSDYVIRQIGGLVQLTSPEVDAHSIRGDMSWMVREPLNGMNGCVSLESVNRSSHFVRHQNSIVIVSPMEQSQLYKDDSSWIVDLVAQSQCSSPTQALFARVEQASNAARASHESSSEDKGWPAWKKALVAAGVVGVVVVGAAVVAPAASASVLSTGASALSSAASVLNSAASALTAENMGAAAALLSATKRERLEKVKEAPPLRVGDPNLRGGKPGDEFKVAECKGSIHGASCWAWDRVIYKEDVINLVERIRFIHGQDLYIHIGTGVHGAENQWKLVDELKRKKKEEGGDPALVNSYWPNEEDFKEFEFMKEDFGEHGHDDHISLYDLRNRPTIDHFHENVKHPHCHIIWAMCYGTHTVGYKEYTDKEFARNWNRKYGKDRSYSPQSSCSTFDPDLN